MRRGGGGSVLLFCDFFFFVLVFCAPNSTKARRGPWKQTSFFPKGPRHRLPTLSSTPRHRRPSPAAPPPSRATFVALTRTQRHHRSGTSRTGRHQPRARPPAHIPTQGTISKGAARSLAPGLRLERTTRFPASAPGYTLAKRARCPGGTRRTKHPAPGGRCRKACVRWGERGTPAGGARRDRTDGRTEPWPWRGTYKWDRQTGRQTDIYRAAVAIVRSFLSSHSHDQPRPPQTASI
jgi:hypothetical protein